MPSFSYFTPRPPGFSLRPGNPCPTAESEKSAPIGIWQHWASLGQGLVPRVIVIYTPNPFGCKMVLIRCIPCLLSFARAGWGLGWSAIKGREIYRAPCRIHLISGGFTDLQLELLSTVYMVPNSYKTNGRLAFGFIKDPRSKKIYKKKSLPSKM